MNALHHGGGLSATQASRGGMSTTVSGETAAARPPNPEGPAMVKLVTRAFMRDPYPALRDVREGPRPAVPILRNGFRQWVVTRYDDVRRVLSDSDFERDVSRRLAERQDALVRPERAALLPGAVRRGVIDRDGRDHRRLRGLIEDDLRLARIAMLRPRIEQLVDGLLDQLPTDEPIDLVARFTRPLAAVVVGDLLGLPAEERDEFPEWESAILTGTSKEEIEHAGRRMYAFCSRLVALKRSAPGNDLITRLVAGEKEGKLDADEAASTVANLLIGGMEPSSAIGSGIALLMTHRGALDALRADPRLLHSCVEEILRYESPFRLLGPRFANAELRLDSVTIPAGELIALCSAAANRDPRRFADPDTFDISRRPNPHLAFGHGPHHCVGVHLGRLETSVALERFFDRFPDSRLDTTWESLEWRPGPYQRRLDKLPVLLERGDDDND